ncbi:MAG: YbaN family protein [Gammaproteobacteria bacterium]|nr:YbaN family protein [Gammaproteobacteria bacterium]MDH5802760.1 YbaN family protein [Gammaproteobacteria bacterium]
MLEENRIDKKLGYMTRWAALILAYLFLGLAIVGLFLPGVPTVPFLLLTAWFAARGSDRLHGWLYAHPRLGRLLIDWEQQGAISGTSKVLAVLMLIVSWIIIYNRVENVWGLLGMSGLFIAIAVFLISRPKPK